MSVSETGFTRIVNDTAHARMHELMDLYSSGVSELTGKHKNRRTNEEESLLTYDAKAFEEWEGRGRFKGVKPGTILAGFSESPARLANAIRRGPRRGRNGRLFRSIRKFVRAWVRDNEAADIRDFISSPEGMRAAGIRSAAVRRPLVAAHAAVRVCKSCARPHSFAQHSSHGAGSFSRGHSAQAGKHFPSDWDVF